MNISILLVASFDLPLIAGFLKHTSLTLVLGGFYVAGWRRHRHKGFLALIASTVCGLLGNAIFTVYFGREGMFNSNGGAPWFLAMEVFPDMAWCLTALGFWLLVFRARITVPDAP